MILWSCISAWPRDKLKPLYLNHHNSNDNQTRQGGDLPWGTPTQKVTWLFNRIFFWVHVTNWKIISSLSQDLCPLNLTGCWLLQGRDSDRKFLSCHRLLFFFFSFFSLSAAFLDGRAKTFCFVSHGLLPKPLVTSAGKIYLPSLENVPVTKISLLWNFVCVGLTCHVLSKMKQWWI